MPETLHDEEEFTTRFNGRTVLRMFGELRRYWVRTLVFLVAIAAVAVADSYNTYLNKRIIDEAIAAHDPSRLGQIALLFGLIMLGQSIAVFCNLFFPFLQVAELFMQIRFAPNDILLKLRF